MSWLTAAVGQAMKRQEVIVRALSGALTWLQAADILGIDARSLRRWRARHEADEMVGLYDRRRLPSPRKAPVAEVQRLLHLYRETYRGFNVRHFYHLARRDICYYRRTVPKRPRLAYGRISVRWTTSSNGSRSPL